jgi:hypothetical protein
MCEFPGPQVFAGADAAAYLVVAQDEIKAWV